MKKIIYIFAFSILFQSCFSYKTVEYNNIDTEKKQTLRIQKDDRTKIKGKLVSKDDNKIIISKVVRIKQCCKKILKRFVSKNSRLSELLLEQPGPMLQH